MMKIVAVLALLSSVSAFAPAANSRTSTKLSAVENQLGVIAPTGFFDPLKLATDENFDEYRAAELKHGRVAQLAVIGYIVPEVFRFPGEIAPGLKFEDIPNGVAALNAVPALGWMQMFFLIGAVDYYGFFTFDSGKLTMDAATAEKRELSELQHGRLAMLAILELLRHDSQNLVTPGFDGLDNLITGLPFLYN